MTTAEKKRYEYQPKDDEGRNLGRPQVLLYDTQEELIELLTEQNKLVIKEMRNLKRNAHTGVTEEPPVVAPVKRFAEPVEFQQVELTADEKIVLARDLSDPLKMEAAFDRLTAARFGAAPQKIGGAVSRAQKVLTDAEVDLEAQAFIDATPDYYGCAENWSTICRWMDRFQLEPSRENFTLAFGRLRDVMLSAGGTVSKTVEELAAYTPPPAVEPPPEVPAVITVTEGPDTYVPPVAPPPPAAELEEPAFQRVSTGLSGMGTSSGGGPHVQPGSELTYVVPAVVEKTQGGGMIVKRPEIRLSGLKALDAMPPEEYKRRFNQEGQPFKDAVEALEKTRKWHPKAY